MISAYIAAYRKSLEALPGGPYPGADEARGIRLKAVVETLGTNGSRAAIREAQAEEPENGLFHYLLAVEASDPREALTHLRMGNTCRFLALTVKKNPISTASPALTPMHGLAKRAEEMIKADSAAGGDLLVAAVQIARSEPQALINLLVGAAFVNIVLKADAMAARESGDRDRVAASARHAAKHREWMASAIKMGMVRQKIGLFDRIVFLRMAGITAAELDAYYKGELKDLEKVAAFETVADLSYRKERKAMSRYLKRVPIG